MIIYATLWTLIRAFFVAGAIAQVVFDYQLIDDGTDYWCRYWMLALALALLFAACVGLAAVTCVCKALLFLCIGVVEVGLLTFVRIRHLRV